MVPTTWTSCWLWRAASWQKEMGTELAEVVELQQDGKTLLVRAGTGWNPGVVGAVTLQMAEGTFEGRAFKAGEPVISPDVATETRFVHPAFLVENGIKDAPRGPQR